MRRWRDFAGGLIVSALIASLAAVLYAAASYPSSVHTFAVRSDGQTISASWFNDVDDEVHAIEDGLLNGFAHALKPSSSGGQNLGTSLLPFGTLYVNTISGFSTRGCDVRLTLTSGAPVTQSDVTAATNVYVTPYVRDGGGPAFCTFYDGVSVWSSIAATEVTVALGTLTSGLPYDIFCYSNSGVIACDAPVAWTNTTTRATALAFQNGVYVKSGTTTRRYVGSFYTASTTTTEDSFAKRYVYSYYGRITRRLRVTESTDTWDYTTATYQQARAQATNQIDVMVGVAESTLRVEVHAIAESTTSQAAQVSIGQDGITPASNVLGQACTPFSTPVGGQCNASLDIAPAVGRHYYTWLERSTASGTTHWYGDNGDSTLVQSGITGELVN